MKRTNKWTKLGLGTFIVLALLLTSAQAVSAANTVIPGLMEVTNNVAHVDDTLVFSIDYGHSLGLGLQQSNIAYVEWHFGDGTGVVNADTAAVTHTYLVPGTYEVEVVVVFESIFGTPSNRSVSATEKLIIEHGNRSPLALSGGAFGMIAGYDRDNDNRLSNAEFFLIVDAWVRGQVEESTFFAAIDLWISEGSIQNLASAAALDFAPQVSQSGARTVVFSAGPAHYASISVKLFDAAGNFITKLESSGSTLTWNRLSATGEALANGVYFYTLSAYDTEGRLISSVMKPFYLMR